MADATGVYVMDPETKEKKAQWGTDEDPLAPEPEREETETASDVW